VGYFYHIPLGAFCQECPAKTEKNPPRTGFVHDGAYAANSLQFFFPVQNKMRAPRSGSHLERRSDKMNEQRHAKNKNVVANDMASATTWLYWSL